MKNEITKTPESITPVVRRLTKKHLRLPLNFFESFRRNMRLFMLVLVAVSAVTFVSVVGAQEEHTGKVQQGITGGAPLVSAEVQEQYGLLTLDTGCSGSLLRNNWAITAAHCVDNPDPEHPGQFITVPENSVTLTANWKSGIQVRKSARIITFRPLDVAIIRVDTPFTGPAGGYNREVYQGNQVPLTIALYGRGIYQFAQGSGATATPSRSDGKYRMATFTTDQEQGKGGDDIVRFSSASGAMLAGGDSGGPTYVKGPSGDLLVGVNSRANYICLSGKPCPATDIWTWAAATPAGYIAPVAPVLDEINRYLGAYVSPTALVSNDFNNDGRGDILWHNASTGESQIWYMNGSSRIGRATIVDGARPTFIGPPFSIVGSNDFNGDGKTDLLWHNSSTGETQIWYMNGYKFSGKATVIGENGSPAFVGLPWSIVSTNDMNGDKKSDIIWHNSSTNETQIWYMNGYRVTGRATVLGENGSPAFVGLPWSIVSSNDFNGDGKTDLLWHNSSTGETQIWYMNGYRVIGRATVLGENGSPAFVGLPFSIVGTNDFNQDRRADILWHNSSTGETQIWYMNGRSVIRRATVTVDAALDTGGAMVGAPWSIMNH